jgi:hypothetical protein
MPRRHAGAAGKIIAIASLLPYPDGANEYRMTHAARIILVVLLFVALGGWLTHRYFRSAVAQDPQGQPIDDLLLSEIGNFANPSYSDTVRSYVKNLKICRRLRYEPITTPANVDKTISVLAPLLERSITRDPKNARVMQAWPTGAQSTLAEHAALMLARCAGLPKDEYLARLGSDAVLRVPNNREMLRYVCDTFLGARQLPDELDQAATASLFADLYPIALTYRSGANEVVAWCNEDAGMTLAIDEAPQEVRRTDVLPQRLSDGDASLFIGSLSQGALVFSGPAEGADAVRAQRSPVLWAHLAIIVSTRGGDYYPILLHSYYDPKRQTWWLARASRQSSPRMATTPHLVF